MNAQLVRQKFLDFFTSKEHFIVSSAPMVVKDDPTLMFTNAGMNQFKDIFLGNSPVKYARIANSQKCLRVSGKHNDLEEVGHDTYHHTMFEMLGNWSFGNYFKEEAIEWAWELLNKVYGIDQDRMYVTIFGGDAGENLKEDSEALEFWKKWISPDRILRGNKKDNFWEMGDTGPCGPCSEIHVDIRNAEDRKLVDGASLVNEGHPLVIEIWNLVFVQYNRMANGSLQPLPAMHVDTGMGFERLCMVLQGKQSNYDTDVFQPIIEKIAEISYIKYGYSSKTDVAMRVVADHLRAIAFAVADGQLPSNNKAGYVIRRILRRAVRYGYTFLNLQDPFIHKLIPTLIQQMGAYFPEIVAQKTLIEKVIAEEEASFLRTLSHGIQKFNQYIATHAGNNSIEGDFAFELYDTFGFPIDLTGLMARELGLTVDMDGFSKELELQKERSRKDAKQETGDWVVFDDSSAESFVGYDALETTTKITRYRAVMSKGKQSFQVALAVTPFYAESGGQVGDTGYIEANGEKILVLDTKKENNLILHTTTALPSDPKSEIKAVVDADARRKTAGNHSATHLMHHALRDVLGTHVEQKGSFVGPDYLRFDFSHFQKLSNEEINTIEKQVNSLIRQNFVLEEKRDVPMETAKASGALALFGEKYGDNVRMIRFGDSVELCGGTHAHATGDIGSFKILSESAIAAGVRRIEAITAEKAESFFELQIETLTEIKELVKNPVDPIRGVKNLIEENSRLKSALDKLNAGKVNDLFRELQSAITSQNGIKLIARNLDVSPALAKDLAFRLMESSDDLIIVLGTSFEGKPGITIGVCEPLARDGKFNAGSLVRELAKDIKGGGGGQPNFATAGGKDLAGLVGIPERAFKLIFK
ncbi:MAG: alanine--tRNA ligase [Lentimicrobium sp.]|jgi:alanyl-tRNA synthetase|nr:alanine--tRNA ligase [Lentimicrobium sp.]